MIFEVRSKINPLQRIFCFSAYLAYRGFLPNVVCHMRADFLFQTSGLVFGYNQRFVVNMPGVSSSMALAMMLDFNVRRREVS